MERIFALPERDTVLTLYESAHYLPCSCFLVCLCKSAPFVVQFEVLNVVIMIIAVVRNVAGVM